MLNFVGVRYTFATAGLGELVHRLDGELLVIVAQWTVVQWGGLYQGQPQLGYRGSSLDFYKESLRRKGCQRV